MSINAEASPLLSDVDNDLLITASWFVEDAFSGVSRPHPVRTAFASRMYTLFSDMHYVRGLAMAVMIALTFFEIPSWCDGSKSKYPCGDPADPTTPMTFNIAFINDFQSVCIEAACLTVLMVNLCVRYLYLRDNFASRTDSVAATVFIAASFVCLIVRVLFGGTLLGVFASYCTGYFRVLIFAVKNRNVRRTARKILLVVAEVQNILSLVVVFVVFFAWVATMLFQNTQEGDEILPDIDESSWELLILLTTANFPDVMMPAYDKHRVVVLFFAFFLCFGVFFLLNVVLAVIFNNYSRNLKLSEAKRQNTRVTKLQLAFDLLCNVSSNSKIIDGVSTRRNSVPMPFSSKELWEHRHEEWYLGEPSRSEGVPWDVMERLFHQMNHYKNIGFIKPSKMRLLFESLDIDNDQVLHWHEFQHICDKLHLALVKKRPKASEMERWFPQVYESSKYQALCAFVNDKRFETAIDYVLVINTILIVVESFPVLNGQKISYTAEWNVWERIEVVFSLVYLVELLLKVVIHGTAKYWRSMKNRFDCIITLSILAVDIYAYLPEVDNADAASKIVLVKILLVARCLRLFRLIINIERYRVFCMTWFRLLPFGKNLIVIMFCAMYIFALLGNQLFGGLISPAIMNSRFNSSGYTENDYMANNFNDMASGMVTLFELIIVNNWFVLAEGHVLVTSKWARWFFIVYYVVSVTVLLNLFIASILEAFVDEYQEEHFSTGSDEIYTVEDNEEMLLTPS
ncbi:hypothetical protein AC1031_015362 [Aphanomyces cochlioides]|nr:hypothetical protein AC1031_015362 [Aphanomyces cochlioides]